MAKEVTAKANLETYGERLVWLRKTADLTQREVQRLSGMSQANVGSLELNRQPEPSYKSFAKLAVVFGVPVSWLAAGEGGLPDVAAVKRAVKRAQSKADRNAAA